MKNAKVFGVNRLMARDLLLLKAMDKADQEVTQMKSLRKFAYNSPGANVWKETAMICSPAGMRVHVIETTPFAAKLFRRFFDRIKPRRYKKA